MTLTNRYVEMWRIGDYHLTFSVTQFALGVVLLTGDEGGWMVIVGPFVVSPIVQPPPAEAEKP